MVSGHAVKHCVEVRIDIHATGTKIDCFRYLGRQFLTDIPCQNESSLIGDDVISIPSVEISYYTDLDVSNPL